jgi:MraZ protein
VAYPHKKVEISSLNSNLVLYIARVTGDDVDGSGQKWSKRDRTKVLQRLRILLPTVEQGKQMFRGNHPTRIDEKGRLKMPADFKRRVDEVYGPMFYITSKDGQRAEIYPLKEWEAIEAKLAQLGSMNTAKKKFLDATNYYGQMTEMDSQGRLLLPQVLREAAGLTEDVVVLGSQTFLEVANRPKFTAKLEAEPMTEAEQAALAAIGI